MELPWKIRQHSRKLAGPLVVYANQGLSSIANLAISFFLVRFLGVAEFGLYATYFAIAFGISAVLNSLIASPLVSLASQKSSAVAAGMILSAAFAVGGASLGLLAAAAALELILFLMGWWHGILLAVAFGVTMAVSEFFRRVCFLTKRVRLVWLFDILRLGSLLIGSVVIVGQLDGAKSDHFVILFCMANAISVLAFAVRPARAAIASIHLRRISVHFRYFLASGRWLAVSSLLQLASDQALLVLAAIVAGPFAAGAIKTCQTIVGIINPVLMALEHTLPRRLGEDIRRFGQTRAHQNFLVSCTVTLATMIAALIPVFIFSEEILSYVARQELTGFGALLQLYCVLWLMYPVTQMLTFVFRAHLKSMQVLVSQVLAAGLAVISGFVLIKAYGAYGAAFGTIIAQATAIVFLLVIFRKAIPAQRLTAKT